MKLIESGEPERYIAMMTDVLRDYLAARVESVQRSQTTPELIAAAAPIHAYAGGLATLLSQADLVKFARQRMTPAEAQALGGQARAIVRQVENRYIELEKEKKDNVEQRAA